jgi:hypothetical protein
VAEAPAAAAAAQAECQCDGPAGEGLWRAGAGSDCSGAAAAGSTTADGSGGAFSGGGGPTASVQQIGEPLLLSVAGFNISSHLLQWDDGPWHGSCLSAALHLVRLVPCQTVRIW